MAIPISSKTAQDMINAFRQSMTNESLWLVMQRQTRIECSESECQLCGGLMGGVLFPELVTIKADTLSDVIAEHPHWKYDYLEVHRIAAHAECDYNDFLRIVPNDDRPFKAEIAGFYRIAVHNSNDVELLNIEVGKYMTPGSELSTMSIGSIGVAF